MECQKFVFIVFIVSILIKLKIMNYKLKTIRNKGG